MTVLQLADLWRSRSSRYCVYLWCKYCCCWNKHHNPSQIDRLDYTPNWHQFLWYLKLFVVLLDQALESNHFLLVSDDDLLELKESKGKHAPLLSEMCKFYRDWHVKSDGVYGNFTCYFYVVSFVKWQGHGNEHLIS